MEGVSMDDLLLSTTATTSVSGDRGMMIFDDELKEDLFVLTVVPCVGRIVSSR